MSVLENSVTPVAFPVGRLKLVTRPNGTGSEPTVKTMGMAFVAASAAGRSDVAGGRDDGNVAVREIGCECGKTAVIIVSPAILDGDVLTLDVPGLAQALAKGVRVERIRGERRTVQKANYRAGSSLPECGQPVQDR
jgi:hypothetical protein